MALIDLRDATIYLKDGLSGTATINDASISANDTTLIISAVKAANAITFNDAGVITITAAVVGSAWNSKSIAFAESAGVNEQTPEAVYAAGTITVTCNNTTNTTTANIVSIIAGLDDWDCAETNGGEYEPGVDDSETGTTACGANVPILNSDDTDLIPVGARFTVPNTASVVYTVTARDPSDAGPTTTITFTPALTANVPANAAVITFQSQRVAITIGEGNLNYTEAQEMEYIRDRGVLDTVRQGEDVPVEVTMDFSYTFVTTGTSETITPPDALKGIGGASEWVTSATDLCEPYAVDIEIVRALSCGATEGEDTLLSDYRWESLEYSLRDATISGTGKCNVTDASQSRA